MKSYYKLKAEMEAIQ